jgi:hypothetical protein
VRQPSVDSLKGKISHSNQVSSSPAIKHTLICPMFVGAQRTLTDI